MAIYNGGLSIKNVSIGTATGSGNAITSLTADGNVITPNKETTFLTSLPNHTHPQDNNFIAHGNEFNVIPTLTGDMVFYINYRQTGGNNSSGYKITEYKFCNGNGENLAGIKASAVYGAVWNDLADSIAVDDDCNLEHGYCYCFDGEKYIKSSKYLDDGIIGIHSDTYSFKMGEEEDKKKMDVAVSGFVLAYVDKEYTPGTPLTCTENGYLTEIRKEDKIEYPERIIATYWKNEEREEIVKEDRTVKVNGRKWVKIK